MIERLSGLSMSLIPVLLLAVLSACDKENGTRILGHWRAERLQVQSISVPMGPEFVVTPRELTSTEGDIRVPISSIQSEGNAVTLEGALGIGLSFYFESSDRIYFDMPLAGRVYFQRVKEPARPARANPAPQAIALTHAPASDRPAVVVAPPVIPTPALQPASSATAPRDTSIDLIRKAEQKLAGNAISEADALLAQARLMYPDEPMVAYNLAVLRMRQGDLDAAVRCLRDAFEHGFRDFPLLDASTEFVSLKADPRYNALLTRYR